MKFNLVFIFVAISAFFYQMNIVTSDYVLPVPGDCTKYQMCDYSGCFVFNCGIGTEFNPRILVCDYPLRDRGACGIRDYNIGPTIPYPGRQVASYPTYQEPTNNYPSNGYPGYPGYPGYTSPKDSNPGFPSTGSGSPGYLTGGSYPGYPSTGGLIPGYPSTGASNPGYQSAGGGSNPAPPPCPSYCG